MRDDHLQNFCQEILAAVGGKYKPHWFNDYFALCTNARKYDNVHHTFVYEKLGMLFYGDKFPFNNSNPKNYAQERWNNKFYVNEKRLAFLKKYAYGA